jgi:hypothetical protein
VEDCIARIGFHLSASANQLPDYVDLDLKAEFDSGFQPDLTHALDSLKGMDSAGKLDWLRNRLAKYGAGTDPIGPVSAALDHLLSELAGGANSEVFEGIRRAVASARTPVAWVT